jgi:hippurate hydrolase
MKSSPLSSVRLCDTKLFAWMQDIRQTIHRHPELSYAEVNTAAYISSKLQEIGILSHKRITHTGIIAEIGSVDKGLCVGLRADMDALPIREDTGLEFSSETPDVMHACGHDGHVAMLLGAAVLLKEMNLSGCVRLLFQPAEEKGNGAHSMIEAGATDGLAAIFSGHIDTHYDTGNITVDEGIICAYADPFEIRIVGKSCHAARPHECKDTIVAAAALVGSMQALVSRGVNPNHGAVVTVGKLWAGETHNVIAGEAILEGSIRSTHPEARKSLLAGLKRMVAANAECYGVEAELCFPPSLPAVINDPLGADLARRAAESVVSAGNVLSQGPSSLGGEDFSFYLQELPGCMVRFGAQTASVAGPAHSPYFDFDENVLSIGAAWYAKVAQLSLESMK